MGHYELKSGHNGLIRRDYDSIGAYHENLEPYQTEQINGTRKRWVRRHSASFHSLEKNTLMRFNEVRKRKKQDLPIILQYSKVKKVKAPKQFVDLEIQNWGISTCRKEKGTYM